MRYSWIMLLSLISILKSCAPKDPPMCGGRTERREVCAPIKSEELKHLRFGFYISPRAYNGKFEGQYYVEVHPSENGKYTLTCNKHTVEVGYDVVKGFQKMIKDYKLEDFNGLYSVTAGLPSEFQPVDFVADYASGENLRFTCNNNPHSECNIMFFRYIRDVLIANGDTTYVVPKDEHRIERLKMEYSEGDGILYSYGSIIMGDDSVKLYRKIYDKPNNKLMSEERIPFPEGYKTRLNDLVEDLGVEWIANQMDYREKPDYTKDPYCYISANDENDNTLFLSTYRGNEIEGPTATIIKKLKAYMDKPFGK